MKFEGAVVKEQGVTFGIAIVKRSVLSSPSEREGVRATFEGIFGGVPTILMAQDTRGVPTFHGRPDIVRFLANVPLEAIPWKEYTLN